MPIRRLLRRIDSEVVDLVRGASLALIIRTAGAATNFLFNVMLARRLGVEGTGAFFLAFTVMTLAVTVAQIGLSDATLRYVATNAAASGWDTVRAAYWRALRLVLGCGAVITLLLWLAAPWIAVLGFSQPDLVAPIRWMTLAIVPTALFRISAMALQGLGRAADAAFCNMVIVPAAAVLLLLVVPVDNVAAAIVIFVAASFLSMLVSGLRFASMLRGRGSGVGPLSEGQLLVSALPLWWVAICQTVNASAAFVFIGIFADQSEVGQYAAANRAAMLIIFALTAINMIVTPKMGAAHQRGDQQALAATTRRGAALSFLVAIPLLIAVVVLAQPIMQLFGPGFGGAVHLLLILAASQFFNAMTGSVGYALVMCGYERDLRNTLLVVALFNIVLNLLLVPLHGATGGAVAQALALVLQNVLAVALVWRRLGFLAVPVPGLPTFRRA